MSNLVDNLIAAGWTAEQFDNDPSAVIDNDDVEMRVLTDADGDTFLLLGHLDTDRIQFFSLESGDPEAVLIQHQPTLSADTIPALVRDLVESGVEVTGGAGVPVDPQALDGLDRLETFRRAFWQVVPFEGYAIARLEGETVDVELIEVDPENWELVLSHDEDFEEVYALEASAQAADVIIEHTHDLTADNRDSLVQALSRAGIEVEREED